MYGPYSFSIFRSVRGVMADDAEVTTRLVNEWLDQNNIRYGSGTKHSSNHVSTALNNHKHTQTHWKQSLILWITTIGSITPIPSYVQPPSVTPTQHESHSTIGISHTGSPSETRGRSPTVERISPALSFMRHQRDAIKRHAIEDAFYESSSGMDRVAGGEVRVGITGDLTPKSGSDPFAAVQLAAREREKSFMEVQADPGPNDNPNPNPNSSPNGNP